MIFKFPRVAISISCFKSNNEARQLLTKIVSEGWECERILIVDSLGTEEFDKLISKFCLIDKVLYFNSEFNLGSAGNLNKRLIWANNLDMDFVLALNHDAIITHSVYNELISYTRRTEKIGALYPLRYLKQRGVYDLSGKNYFPRSVVGSTIRPNSDIIDVYWSSSNGALYSTKPIRDLNSIYPDKNLWMGWEDYLYGLQIHKMGYSQLIITKAETIDNYEYKNINIFSKNKIFSDKPIWYCYYDPRNLLLIAKNRLKSPILFIYILLRILLGIIIIPIKYKNNKKMALKYYLFGIRDGLLNIDGKWILP